VGRDLSEKRDLLRAIRGSAALYGWSPLGSIAKLAQGTRQCSDVDPVRMEAYGDLLPYDVGVHRLDAIELK
jgi:hypothetical protein